MNQQFLPDISGIVRVLIAFGLVAAMAAHVIARMVSRHGHLPMQLLGIAVIGVFAAVLVVATPEWGAACTRFLFESVFDPVLPQYSTQTATAPQTAQR